MEKKPTAPTKYAGKFKAGECETEGLALKLTVKCRFFVCFFFVLAEAATLSASTAFRAGTRCSQSVMSSRRAREVKAATCARLAAADKMTVNNVITSARGRQPSSVPANKAQPACRKWRLCTKRKKKKPNTA